MSERPLIVGVIEGLRAKGATIYFFPTGHEILSVKEMGAVDITFWVRLGDELHSKSFMDIDSLSLRPLEEGWWQLYYV